MKKINIKQLFHKICTKQNLKRVLVVIVAVFIAIMLIPFVKPLEVKWGDYTVQVKGMEARLTKYNGKDPIVQTPDYVWGRPVTTIGCNCFSNDYIENVNLSKNVKVIVCDAFYGCDNLQGVNAENVVEIGMGAFFENTKLKSVDLGTHLEIIGDCAFKYCTSLEYIPSPDSLQRIDSMAFECSGLTEVGDLSGVNLEADHIFDGTPWMEKQQGDYVVINGVLQKYKGEGSISVIPDTVEVITTAYGYHPDRNISVYIPSSTTKIVAVDLMLSEKYTVYIPENVEFIHYSPYMNEPYLAKIITVSGSYAEQYAKEHGMNYEIVDGWEVPEEE